MVPYYLRHLEGAIAVSSFFYCGKEFLGLRVACTSSQGNVFLAIVILIGVRFSYEAPIEREVLEL